jgi:threonyl-tRNA synthetase
MAQGIRAEVFAPSDTLNKRIQRAQAEKIPYMLVAGSKETEARTLAVRKRGSRDQETVGAEDFVRRIVSESAARK